MDHGPRYATGVSCMTGAGASMAVEGAFSEFAPQFGGPSLVTRAAPDAIYENGILEVEQMAALLLEENLTPRRLAGVSAVMPSRQAQPALGPPLGRRMSPPFTQPAVTLSAVTRQRQGDNASFRGAPPPPVFQYSSPVVRPAVAYAQMESALNDVASSRQPTMASEVRAYPYMYPTPDYRLEAAPRDGSTPQPFDRYANSYIPFDRYAHSYSGFNAQSYTGVIERAPRDAPSYVPRGDVPSYVPRVVPATSQGLSMQQMPAQGLSLQQLSPGPGLSYPGPVPQRNPQQFGNMSSPYLAQAPVTIESTPAKYMHAATSPATVGAPSIARPPQRGTTPSSLQSYGMQYNGQTARYPTSLQPVAPPQSLRNAPTQGAGMANVPTPFPIPTAAYVRPSQMQSQVPSFTSPIVGSGMIPQVQAFALPQLQQSWAGQLPFQYASPVVALPS